MNDTIIVDFCDSDGSPSERDEARAYAVTIHANFNKYSDAMMKVVEHVRYSNTLTIVFPKTNGNYIENDIYDVGTGNLIGVTLDVTDLQ